MKFENSHSCLSFLGSLPNMKCFCSTILGIVVNAILMMFLLFVDIACKDDDPELPPITITGEGTFGCLIDGAVYLPQGADSEPFIDGSFDMIVVSGGSRNVNLQLVVRDTLHHAIVENEPYYFNQDNITCVYNNIKDKKDCEYRDTPVSGYIKFARIDFEKHIVSGVFEFTAYSTTCGRIVNVTDGRFDIRTDR